MANGIFITFEGGEGAGKSTQILRLADVLKKSGNDVLVTREPGGSPGAEAVRHVLLSGAAEPFGAGMEAILFAAARSDHVEQVIRPAIESGTIVLCDRFMDSSRVYQGVTGNLDANFMSALEAIAINGVKPDLTIILDLPATEGLSRANTRRGEGGVDRFERETLSIHERRRQAFLEIAQNEPERCAVVDARQDQDAVTADIMQAVAKIIPTLLQAGGNQ